MSRVLPSGAILSLLVLMTSGFRPSPEGTIEDSVEEVLAGLIERTNELDSFHLVYSLKKGSEEELEEATIELIYESPDLGRLRLTAEEGSTDTWLINDEIFVRGAEDSWQRANFPAATAPQELLFELFPRSREVLEQGLRFVFDLRDDPETDETKFEMRIARSNGRRSGLLSWLQRMQKRSDEVELEGQALILRGESFEFHVSREHGFPSLIKLRGKRGTMEVQLLECNLNEDLGQDLVQLPSDAGGAELDEEMNQAFAAVNAPARLRNEGFARVHFMLEEEGLDWDADTQERWRAYLEELHRAMIEGQSTARLNASATKLYEFIDWLRKGWADEQSPERRAQLEGKIEEARSTWTKSVREVPEGYLGQLPALTVEGASADQLLEVEGEVVHALHEEFFIGPFLARFEDEVATIYD